MTETQTPGRKPKKKKNKESHNAVERHRKEKINAGINRIGNLLPCSQALKQSKIMILDQAFRYITELKKQNDAMLLEGGDKIQSEEIRRLRCQLEELRKESAHYMELLKAHDILEDPSVHWKGKQRCAKTANVTQTFQTQKGIIVYSSGNLCPAGKDLSPGIQPSETLVLQQSSEVSARLRVNGALLQVNTSSSTPSLLPGSALTAPHSTAAVQVIDQCVVETPAVAPSLPPSVSYIALQIPTVTTALPPQPVPATPVQTLTVPSTSTSPLLSESAAVPVSSLTSLNHITPPRPTASDTLSLAPLDTSTRTVSYTAIAQSQPPLRAQAAGSTQTTWTTLQMAGNTVQPVCQNIPTSIDNPATQSVQRVNVCQVQMQPAVPAPQTPIPGPIQSQLRTTLLSPQNPSAVLGQSAILPQPAVVSQPQPAVLQPSSLVTHPPLIPQPQSAVLPLLQTMQVLQVKPANPTASGVTAAQSTNNPSVVILQQANTCPAQSVVREEMTNQTPCQHIVIIQAPNQPAPASQNPPVSVVSAAVPQVPSVSTTMPSTSTSSVTSPQTVGGKQLVHILPRPVQPQPSKCQPITPPSTSTSAAVTPKTITVNGQVFALQPVKTTDNLISNGGQTTLQLVQPTTTEEPTTNVALNSLGALSSLNQSITQGIPLAISTQNSLSLPSIIQQQPPNVTTVSESTAALPVQVPCLKPIKPALVVNPPKTPSRKPPTSISAKKTMVTKIKSVKRKEQKPKQPPVILAKTTAVTSVSQTMSKVFRNSATEIISSTSTVATTTVCSQSISPSVNVTIAQNTDKINTMSSSDANAVSSQSNCSSIGSATTAKTDNLLNIPNTSVTTAVSDITSRLLVSSTTFNEIKTTKGSENALCVTKISVPEVKLQKESSTIQKKTSQPVVSETKSTCGIQTQLQPICTNSTSTVAASLKKTTQSSPTCHPQESHIQETTPGSATSAVCTTNSVLSPFLCEPNSAVSSLGAKTVLSDVSPMQKTNINSLCQPCESPSQGGQSEGLEEKQNKTEQINSVTDNSGIPSKKDFALNQQVYTNLDDQTSESSLPLSRQTESPMSTVTGGRGFSVASMLPQGQSMSAASGSFSSFILTSEQAEMLALAMLEQDSPERKTGGCTGNKTALSNPSTGTWEPAKPPVSTNKDCVSPGQQGKFHKTLDTLKTSVPPPVRGQISEANLSGQTISRHPQNISYSHSQSAPPPQNTSQSSTVASLSVNNLIRTSSIQQPYSGSPMTGQTSVPSPVCTTAHISQSSNNTLSPCSASSQHEYTPLKTALLRSQSGLNMGERQVKMIPKRPAHDEVIVNSGKRAKPCPPSGNAVTQMEVKGPDHAHLIGAQLPPISSGVMTRISNNSGGPLFSSNSFVSPVVRPSEPHCPPSGPMEQSQPGVLHLPQGHLQHATPQSGPNLGVNPYMKQQQEQQRQHLYHLQQHLTQADPAQRHSLHQRALQQQEQQQQHAQKKRGLVRGSQTTSPAALQQKQQQVPQHQQQSHPPTPQQLPQVSHPQQAQNQPHPQQLQSSHSRHQQHLQQQLHQQQQQQQHFRHQDKSCEAPRPHHSTHLTQQDHHKPGQDHNAMQRMMGSRNLEQALIAAPSNPVSRSSDLACAPSRQERHRVSNYSAEALIGKSPTTDQRMSLHLQPGRITTHEQPDLRGYLDTSRAKANITHNPQNHIPPDHPGPSDGQRVSECSSFKGMGAPHPVGGFEVPVSRGNEMTAKSGPQRGFRMGAGPQTEGRNRGAYNGPHSASQVQVGPVQEGCHQSFMQSLLSPHLPEQSSHQQVVQCCPPVSMEYCVSRSSSTELQAKASSPNVPQSQKAPGMRLGEANKSHISQVGSNLHGGVRTGLPHPPPPNSSSEAGRSSAPSRPPAAVSQHSRHVSRDTLPAKLRPGDRTRSGTVRPTNPFDSEGHLPLPSGGGVLLGRPQSGGEARRSTIVRFMPDTTQVPSDNNLVPDQHLAQNFGFPFIPEGGMNPPPINTNSSFIPSVSQPSASRTPSLLPVETQNTLPSFYPSYSPAAHPSLPSDVTLQYFPNQMFSSPSTDKSSAPPLNNRFGSILSPPRPVGFAQASFPLLPDMTPMPPIANSSGITPHISNFSLTSLFPEMATGMAPDGSAMPMSPLLSLSNTSADSGKQGNRPAHNISHILGHDGSSAV